MSLNRPKIPVVCVIDDSESSLAFAREILEERGCTVVTADNTYEALHVLTVNKVDLVLCDVVIPPFDGFEFSRVLRSRWNKEELPVVFVSTRNSEVDKARSELAGGNGYLTKPYSAEELFQVVKKFTLSA